MNRDEQSDHDVILDLAVIAGLRELGGEEDPGLLLELVGMFLEDAPNYVREIAAGFEAQDLERVKRASHTLKSSAANMGAMSLSGLARSIESTAKSSDMGLLRELSNTLSEVYRETAEALSGLDQ